MRIIAGKHRGRVLAEFQGRDIRPTTDRVKESLFNILMCNIPDSRVLDLFSGSGNLGFEALSRGAREVVFNDGARTSIEVLKKNMAMLKETGIVYQSNYLSLLTSNLKPFDIIFIDPPYASDFGKISLEKIAEKGLLTKNGIAVFETNKVFEESFDGLEMYDERHYGKTYLYFYRRKQEENL